MREEEELLSKADQLVSDFTKTDTCKRCISSFVIR